MPNAPKTQHRSVRFDNDTWTDLLAAAKSQNTDRAKLLNEFAAWYLRRPGAKLPARPNISDWSDRTEALPEA
jgi:ABC-type thiamine transport system substrate-binding protein